MGSRLVALVLARWTHLSDRAFRLLIRMAHTALDDPNGGVPAGIYFGGRDLLAMTLRSQSGSTASQYREVRTVLAELAKAGAIERIGEAHRRARAVYRLTLEQRRAIDTSAVDDEPAAPRKEGDPPPIKEGVSATKGGGLTPSKEGVSPPPYYKEEPQEELYQEPKITQGSNSPPSTGTPDEHPEPSDATTPANPVPPASPDRTATCERCGTYLDPDSTCRNRRCRDPTLAQIIPLKRPA